MISLTASHLRYDSPQPGPAVRPGQSLMKKRLHSLLLFNSEQVGLWPRPLRPIPSLCFYCGLHLKIPGRRYEIWQRPFVGIWSSHIHGNWVHHLSAEYIQFYPCHVTTMMVVMQRGCLKFSECCRTAPVVCIVCLVSSGGTSSSSHQWEKRTDTSVLPWKTACQEAYIVRPRCHISCI